MLDTNRPHHAALLLIFFVALGCFAWLLGQVAADAFWQWYFSWPEVSARLALR